MSLRRALIIHPDASVRTELRLELDGVYDVVEVSDRAEALAALAATPPAFVICHTDGIKKTLRDLERHAPGAFRAVVCPAEDERMRQHLVELSTEGHVFITLDGTRESLAALIRPRSS